MCYSAYSFENENSDDGRAASRGRHGLDIQSTSILYPNN